MKKIKEHDMGKSNLVDAVLNLDKLETEETDPCFGPVVEIKPSAFDEVNELKIELFNVKFKYDLLLNFTRDLLTHEQHVKFAAKKEEIFG